MQDTPPHRVEEILFGERVDWNDKVTAEELFGGLVLEELYELLENYVDPKNKNGLEAPSNRVFREYAEELNPELPDGVELEFGGYVTSPDNRKVVISSVTISTENSSEQIPKNVVLEMANFSPQPTYKTFEEDLIELRWD